MYFLRVDYVPRNGSGVERTRDLCKSLSAVLRTLRMLRDCQVHILSIKVEFCV